MVLPSEKPLTEEEKKKAKDLFVKIDADKDGKISHADLKKAMEAIGWRLSDDEIKEIIKKADPKGTGSVSAEEFTKVCERRPVRRRIEAQLKSIFRALDTDSSGELTKSDLKQVLKEYDATEAVSDKELDDMMKRVDKSGDGKVSFEEFANYFFESRGLM